MRKSRRERGESQFGCLIGLILLGLAIFVAWKMIPVKVKAAEVPVVPTDRARSTCLRDKDLLHFASAASDCLVATTHAAIRASPLQPEMLGRRLARSRASRRPTHTALSSRATTLRISASRA